MTRGSDTKRGRRKRGRLVVGMDKGKGKAQGSQWSKANNVPMNCKGKGHWKRECPQLLSIKSEAFERFKEYRLAVANHTGGKIRALRSAQDREYLSGEFVDYLMVRLVQIDVKTTFFNDFVEEEIYIDQPEGFTSVGEEYKATTTESTIEFEYIAASEAAKEAIWMKNYIQELGVVPSIAEPVVIFYNNNRAITQAKESRSHHQSKLILRRYHLLGEMEDRNGE
ncbi:UNVERIFIED_CONTAM: Retrovirus-related Pol polyprotein from transposon TNT 1-94 [Sesamum calycinum]|uniref:Retrovirus-related Pol polyprotein from transposon TNT 1-94 n=1 Tax=Sesamum calycinum TaxID=2727403 RepID=A0AAW2SBI2_9LAMI